MRTTVLAFSVAVAFLSAATHLNASDDKMSRDSLRDLPAVHVVVERLRPDTLGDGLSDEQIQTDVELRLRKAGVVVSNSAIAMLYVNINPVKSDSGFYAYSCSLELQQAVTVLSNKALTMAPTWSSSSAGFVGRNTMAETIRGHIGDLVDMFLNAYLSVNQK
jgi:hypothetical protein